MRNYVISTAIATATLIFVGCGTSVSSISAPDGSKIFKVKCNKDSSKCFEEASESCNNGSYQVLSSESHAGGILADLIPGPVTWYSMNYKCGPSDGKMPSFPFTGSTYTPPPVINYNSSPSFSKPTYTNCYKVGNSVNCTSY